MENQSLRRAREHKGWSQRYVAEQIGTQRFTVTRWELGLAFPSPYFRQKLCEIFESNIEDLGLIPGSRKNNNDTKDEGMRRSLEIESEMYFSTMPSLPVFTSSLVGRDDLIQTFKEQVCTEQKKASTAIYGLPGVGKTALAVAFAHNREISAHCRDGVLWIGLGPTPNILAALGDWAIQLGLSAADVSQVGTVDRLSRVIQRLIGKRRMLLIIDDAWEIEHALAFRVGGPECMHLLTTRLPLLATQFAPHWTVNVPELNDADGITLLAQLAPDVIKQEPQEALALVREVGGLPLALILMGNYLNLQATSGQPRRIHAALAQLRQIQHHFQISMPIASNDLSSSNLVGVPLSLKTAIAMSVQILDEDTHILLQILALFPAKPSSFSEDAAQDISGVARDSFLAELDVLLDAGLVESVTAGRYAIHQTIVGYLRLAPASEADQRRFLVFFFQFLATHQTAFEDLDQELANITAAFDIATHLPSDVAFLQGVVDFLPYLRRRGYYALAEHYLPIAHTFALHYDDKQAVLRILIEQADIAAQQGAYEDAMTYVKEALQGNTEQKYPFLHSSALVIASSVAHRQGQFTVAQGYLDVGLVLAQQYGFDAIRCQILNELGALADTRGKSDEAEHWYAEGMQIAEEIGITEQIIHLYENIGTLKGRRGSYGEAIIAFEHGLVLAREIDYRRYICTLLYKIGISHSNQAQYVQAEQEFQQAMHLADQLDNEDIACSILSSLGRAIAKQGRFDEGMARLKEALARARLFNNAQRLSMVLALVQGILTDHLYSTWVKDQMIDEVHLQEAERYLDEQIAIVHALDMKWYISTSLHERGRILLLRGDWEAATVAVHESMNAAQKVQADDLYARSLFLSAIILAKQGNIEGAIVVGEQSQNLLEACGSELAQEASEWVRAIALYRQAREYAVQGNLAQAMSDGNQSQQILQQVTCGVSNDVRAWLECIKESLNVSQEEGA